MNEWRLITNLEADVADLLALPAAIIEARIAGRYILSTQKSPQTLLIQRVKRKGMLVGADVLVDREEASKKGMDVVVQPRGGRGGLRPADTISLEELMLKSKERFKSEDVSLEDVAALIYTSGTTGNPKGVMLTHRNFLAECEATLRVIPTMPEDRFASLVPFFHIYGLAIGLVAALFRGCSSVLIPQYSPKSFLRKIEDERVSILIAIPTQYFHLLLAVRRRPIKKSYLRYCISGAAPLPVKVIEAFKESFGVEIIEGYGLTETTAAVAVNPRDRIKPGSVGLPVEGAEIKVVDDRGEELPQDRAGEILIKGEMVMKGYYNLPEETRKTLKDGWLYTGDIGYKDGEGYLYITDRKKDIIIKGGFNISPKEIEEILCEHPKVEEAAVVGYKEKEGREEAIKAFIVGKDLTPEEILRYCRKRLASYKVPDEIELKDSLPKSATGKVLRKELRKGYKDLRFIERDES